MYDLIDTLRSGIVAIALAAGTGAPIDLLEDKSFDCIARTVYAEARGEGADGMALVVMSIINRHKIQGKSACRIAREAYDGYRLVRHRDPSQFNTESWNYARLVTLNVISGRRTLDRCKGVTHFLNPDGVRRMPSWASEENRVCRVGNHIAYQISNI